MTPISHGPDEHDADQHTVAVGDTSEARQLHAINTVALALSDSLDLDDVLGKALTALLDITGLTSGVIYIHDAAADELVGRKYLGFEHGYEHKIRAHSMHVRSFPVRGMESPEPLLFDIADDQGPNRITDYERRAIQPEGIVNAVTVRLESSHKVYGVVILSAHRTRRPFEDDEIRTMKVLAGQIGVAIERAALYADQQRQTVEATMLYDSGRILGAGSNLDEAISAVLEIACTTFELKAAELTRWEANRGDRVIRSGPPSVGEARVTSYPLKVADADVGMLQVWTPPSGGVHDERPLHQIVDMLAMRIWNDHLHESSTHLRVLQERNRIARELHDSLIQEFHGIHLQLSVAKSSLRNRAIDETLDHLDRAHRSALDGLQQARASLVALRSLPEASRSLTDGLRHLATNFSMGSSIPCQVDTYGLEPPIELDVRDALLRAVREALRNVAKHAGAQSVELFVAFRTAGITITIEDDGIGFDLDEPGRDRSSTSFGLLGVREILREIGAVLEIESAPGEGTTCTIFLPRRPNPRMPT